MTTVIPDGFGSVAFEYTTTLGTGPFIVTHGVAIDGDFPLQDQVDLLQTGWVDAWADLTFNEFTFNRAILTVPAPGGGLGSIVSSTAPVAGGASGDPGMVAMAVLIDKRTSVLGRHGRGRCFVPGLLGENDVDGNGNFSNSTVAIYQAAIDGYDEFIKGAGPDPEVNNNPYLLHGSVDPLPSQITSWVVTNKVGILRKRLR